MTHHSIPPELLTGAQTLSADRATIARGTPSAQLMENAARAVVDFIASRYAPRRTLVACGTGNNGGDGRITARMLRERGWDITECDAKHCVIAPDIKLIVDALFGVGLNRAVEGEAKAAIEAINASGVPVVAVDIPSGIHADTGQAMGVAVFATHTVTFYRAKPGLFLMPGKQHAGEVLVRQIGVSDDLADIRTFFNQPALWKLPHHNESSHKYTRGHALVVGGGIDSTGAARLAAKAALRIGAGLVSIACDGESLPVYAAALEAVMTKQVDDRHALAKLLADPRISALCIGPGAGVNERTQAYVLDMLETKKPCVLDADALTVFSQNPQVLFDALHANAVLTPHEGEFTRLFSISGSKLERARSAAKLCGAVVLLKGSDTVIASPDGRAAINANAPPWLATAGSGDVLAGLITGLLAQGMAVLEAACAGAWLHGQAAQLLGTGMIAEDIEKAVPGALRHL